MVIPPRIIAERCVHSLLETAGCSACVDACPRGAWILDDEALGLDLEACDGCSLCHPACPEGAIDFRLSLAIRDDGHHPVALAACEQSGVDGVGERLPCIHGLGLQEVLRLYRRGVRQLVVALGDCDACQRGVGPRLDRLIDSLNRSLQQSGHPPMRLRREGASAWAALRTQSETLPAGPLVSRRGFLRAFTAEDERVVDSLSLLLGGEGGLFDPPGRLLPDLTEDAILPWVPVMVPQACSGCDACIRVCPHQALRLQEDEAGPAYWLEAARCTGCGLCQDVCDRGAVSILQWQVQERRSVPLRQSRCPSCGAPFHEPEAMEREGRALCRICSGTDHQRNLFQVL